MLNVLFRCAARLARASLFGAVALGTSAWASAAHAAERASPEPAVFTPFKHYQGWRDEPLQDWREANERVGEIGGWRTYLREMQQDGDGADGGQAHHGH
jgi:hypothetical protein